MTTFYTYPESTRNYADNLPNIKDRFYTAISEKKTSLGNPKYVDALGSNGKDAEIRILEHIAKNSNCQKDGSVEVFFSNNGNTLTYDSYNCDSTNVDIFTDREPCGLCTNFLKEKIEKITKGIKINSINFNMEGFKKGIYYLTEYNNPVNIRPNFYKTLKSF